MTRAQSKEPRLPAMAELLMLTGHEFFKSGNRAEANIWYAKAADVMRAENSNRAKAHLGARAI